MPRTPLNLASRANKLELIETEALRKYRRSLNHLVKLTTDAKDESTRIAAHRVFQEYVVSYWKDEAKEEKKRALLADSKHLPSNITLALTGLPVNAQVAVAIRDGVSEQHIVDYRQPSDNTALAVLPGPDPTAGEAAEIRPAVLTDTPHPIDFPCNSKEVCDTSSQSVSQDGGGCSEESRQDRAAFASASELQPTSGKSSARSRTKRTQSRSLSGTRSGSTPRSTVGKCEGWRYEEQGRAECGEIFQKRNWKQLRCDRCRGELQNATTLAWRNRKNKKTAAVFEQIRENLGE